MRCPICNSVTDEEDICLACKYEVDEIVESYYEEDIEDIEDDYDE